MSHCNEQVTSTSVITDLYLVKGSGGGRGVQTGPAITDLATSVQGGKADTALQPAAFTGKGVLLIATGASTPTAVAPAFPANEGQVLVARTAQAAGFAFEAVGGSTAILKKACSGAVGLLAADAGKVCYNTAATDISLPTMVDGYWFRFAVAHASYLKVIATNNETIRYQGTVTAANGYFRSQTVGNVAFVLAVNGVWYVSDIQGVWTWDS
jgi:hypothetical protein